MKKHIKTFLIMLLVFTLCFPCTAFAADEWSEEYYRAVDSTGDLSDAQIDELDSLCIDFIEAWHLDLAMLSLASDKYPDYDINDLARDYFLDCDFGYGGTHDGFMFVFYPDNGEAAIYCSGRAEGFVSQDYLDYILQTSLPLLDEHGVFGPMYSVYTMLNDYIALRSEDPSREIIPVITQEPETAETPDAAEASENAGFISHFNDNEKADASGGMPSWYPSDPANFTFYHDESARRVVDEADILTGEEETALEERIGQIRGALSKDIVIFTDTSTHGLGEAVYAADFYDFNGYGYGNEREGVCLMICMDPDDRGGWCACTGRETMGLYTEAVANQIDDMLYDFLGEGDYYTGFSDWIENIRRMYTTGSPYLESWALEQNAARFHDADAARIVDDAYLLSQEQINVLTEKAKKFSDEFGVDVAVHFARSSGSLDDDQYSERYYAAKGYGFGDDYSGLLMTVFRRPGSKPALCITGYGSAGEKLTHVNEVRLEAAADDPLDEYDYTGAVDKFLSLSKHMMRTGRVPKGLFSWIFVIGAELLAGLAAGGIGLSKAKRTMATPRTQSRADSYLLRESVRVANIEDRNLGTTRTRVYSPPPKNNDRGSSSSGRSSYSGSYRGSSGASHSGSGRKF